jgi:predicted nucleic acid-binding protein
VKKIFVDTNIILRYLLGDPDSIAIQKILNGKNTLIVSDIVIAEVVWTLSRFYKWQKEKIIEFLVVLLKNPNIEFNESIIFPSFNTFLKCNVKYTDAYISELMRNENIKEIYSFDHDFDKIPEIKKVEP